MFCAWPSAYQPLKYFTFLRIFKSGLLQWDMMEINSTLLRLKAPFSKAIFQSTYSFESTEDCWSDLLCTLNHGQSFSHQFLVDPTEVCHFLLAFMMDVHAAFCTENSVVTVCTVWMHHHIFSHMMQQDADIVLHECTEESSFSLVVCWHVFFPLTASAFWFVSAFD